MCKLLSQVNIYLFKSNKLLIKIVWNNKVSSFIRMEQHFRLLIKFGLLFLRLVCPSITVIEKDNLFIDLFNYVFKRFILSEVHLLS